MQCEASVKIGLFSHPVQVMADVYVHIIPLHALYSVHALCATATLLPEIQTGKRSAVYCVCLNMKSGGVMKSIIVGAALTGGLMIAASAQAVDMPPLAKKLNCTACHAIDHKVVGPAWQDVANRYTGKGVKTYVYKGKEYPLIEGLVLKVSKGGAGNWGSMPMPANDLTGTKRNEIRQLVEFEQSLATKK
jgi:cytochrome c